MKSYHGKCTAAPKLWTIKIAIVFLARFRFLVSWLCPFILFRSTSDTKIREIFRATTILMSIHHVSKNKLCIHRNSFHRFVFFWLFLPFLFSRFALVKRASHEACTRDSIHRFRWFVNSQMASTKLNTFSHRIDCFASFTSHFFLSADAQFQVAIFFTFFSSSLNCSMFNSFGFECATYKTILAHRLT